jgi:hypothetical protein
LAKKWVRYDHLKLWTIYATPSEYTEWNIRFWNGYPLDDYEILPKNIGHKEEQPSWRHNDEKMSRIISLKLPKLANGTDFRKEDLSFL